MTRQEFLDTLRRALNRELDAAEVEEHIAYYDNYIRERAARGQEESRVIAELGDPRLIARTILQVDENRSSAGAGKYDAEETVFTENPDGSGYTRSTSRGAGASDEDTWYTQDDAGGSGRRGQMHTFRASGWRVTAVLIGILILLCIVLGAVAAVVWRLLPVILVVGAVLWIYHRFFN